MPEREREGHGDNLNQLIARLSAKLNAKMRELIDRRMAERAEALWEAWREREFYDARRIARLLAGA
eukprot:6395587-Pyramimonas_sp.AAC.1